MTTPPHIGLKLLEMVNRLHRYKPVMVVNKARSSGIYLCLSLANLPLI